MVAASFKPKGPEIQTDRRDRAKEDCEHRSLARDPWTDHGQKGRTFRNIVKELSGAFTLSDIHEIDSNTAA